MREIHVCAPTYHVRVYLLVQRLMEAVHAEEVNYEDLMLLLAHSSPEDINYCHKEKGGRAPLHVACVRGLIAAVQLLLWVGCLCVCVCACVHMCFVC